MKINKTGRTRGLIVAKIREEGSKLESFTREYWPWDRKRTNSILHYLVSTGEVQIVSPGIGGQHKHKLTIFKFVEKGK